MQSVAFDQTPTEPLVGQAIELHNLCKYFKCLPAPGGLLDQDSFIVWLLQLVMRANNERQRMEHEKRSQQYGSR